jgi:hypothetical protein
MLRTSLLLAGVVTLGLSLAACQTQQIGDTERIFVAPVWTGPETLEYQLRRRDPIEGYCTYLTEPGPERTTLTTDCVDAEGVGHSDDTVALVDAQTLEPISSERIRIDVDMGERNEHRATYQPPDEVVISQTTIDLVDEDVDEVHEVARELPEPTEDAPDPGWYDEASLFWLMRGIPLEDGFEGRYANVNIGIARIVGVDVEVDGIEEVTVPAGTFQAWSIRVESSITNRFWVDVEAPHRVVRARLEDTTFELTGWE